MKPIVANNKPVKVSVTEGEEYYFAPVVVLMTSHFVTAHMLEPNLNPSHLRLKSLTMLFYVSASIRQTYPFVMALISSLTTVPSVKKGRVFKLTPVKFLLLVLRWKNLQSSLYIS